MEEVSPGEITRLLVEIRSGNKVAESALVRLVYEELRRIARAYMRRESPGHTLQATALVHEAYLRLVDQRRVEWRNRKHFFAVAAQLMRRILVDHARARTTAKRHAAGQSISLDAALVFTDDQSSDLIALDAAFSVSNRSMDDQSRIVDLRSFGDRL